MKGRGIAVVVVLVAAVLGGALWWMRSDDRDGAATPAAPQGRTPTAGRAGAHATTVARPRATVTVTDDAGAIAGAIVRFAPEDGEVIAVKTDRDGVATTELAPGAYEISASAAGHEPAAAAPQTIDADVTLAIVLPRGGVVLRGVVTDVGGGPIAGARIDAARLGAMARPDRAVASALTGPDGTYQLAVAEGQLLVAARSVDYAPQSRIVDVGRDGATADFALVPGGVIEGVVLDEHTRQPVAGAIVRAARDTAAILLAETGGAVATAGGDGTFRLTGLRPGAYELGAVGGGRRSKVPTIVGLGVAEQVGDVELLVGKSPVVRGHVVDEAGAPVEHARVVALGRGGGEDRKCDDQGAFVIDGLAPGKYMLVGASPDHLGGAMTPVEVKDQDVDGVIVRIARGVKIVGRVEPPQVCDVKLDVSDDRPGGPMRIVRMSAPTTTGPDGRFELGPVDDGPKTVEARCASGDQGRTDVDVKPGLGEVIVKVTPGGVIAGRVVDGDGKPVAGVTVMASPQAGGERTMIVNGVVTSGVQALTSGDGSYEVRGLAPGAYRMAALDRGRPMALKGRAPKVALGRAERRSGVELVVERPNGVIQGVVLGPDGAPLAEAWVSVSQDLESMVESMVNDRDPDDAVGGRMMMRVEARDDGDGGGLGGASAIAPVLTDASGRFAFHGLPRARYAVVAEAQAGALRGRVEAVEPDAEITVKAAGVSSLSGTVKGARGPTALFTIELVGPTRAQRTFTGGTFELGRVDPGAYTVKVTSSDGNAEAKVTVAPGTPAHVDLVLEANAVVVGTLVDAAGQPVAGVPVVVIDDAGDGSLMIRLEGPPPTSGPDGKFRVEHAAGTGVLVVMTPPSPITRRGLALEAGKVLDVGEVRVAAPPSSSPPGPPGPPGPPAPPP